MVDINGYEIKSAFSGGEPLKAIYSLGEKVWPVDQPVEFGGLKFTALEAGSFGIEHNGTNATTTKPNLSYSKNGGSWVEWDYTNIPVVKDDFVYFKGINDRICRSLNDYSTFTSTGKISASGNIMSLLYGDDFEGKLDLSDKNFCFYRLFYNCKSLTNAPELPATILVNGCYRDMFNGCTSLTTAPELPATKLAFMCYGSMFEKCTSLVTAPELPATTLSVICYQNMFYGCTSLTTAPELPATILVDGCYHSMFRNCTSLTTAPELPATKLINNCYIGMFEGCTSLVNAPELPATELAGDCYSYMFEGCTSLVNAPELPATELAGDCYLSMFYGCTKLNYVKANFTTEPSIDYTGYWLYGVASTGTFVANSSATWTTSITRNESTVPAGWTIQK